MCLYYCVCWAFMFIFSWEGFASNKNIRKYYSVQLISKPLYVVFTVTLFFLNNGSWDWCLIREWSWCQKEAFSVLANIYLKVAELQTSKNCSSCVLSSFAETLYSLIAIFSEDSVHSKFGFFDFFFFCYRGWTDFAWIAAFVYLVVVGFE